MDGIPNVAGWFVSWFVNPIRIDDGTIGTPIVGNPLIAQSTINPRCSMYEIFAIYLHLGDLVRECRSLFHTWRISGCVSSRYNHGNFKPENSGGSNSKISWAGMGCITKHGRHSTKMVVQYLEIEWTTKVSWRLKLDAAYFLWAYMFPSTTKLEIE